MKWNASQGSCKGAVRLLAIIVCMVAARDVFAAIWFVKADAAPGGDGQSWATAFNDLNDALNIPFLFEGDQIWVAAGVYVGPFELKERVRLYGGFKGNELLIDDRKRDGVNFTHETILSGADLGAVLIGDSIGGGRSGDRGDRTLVNGFTITRSAGAAVVLEKAAPVFKLCRFLNNDGNAVWEQGPFDPTGVNRVPEFFDCTFVGSGSAYVAGGAPVDNHLGGAVLMSDSDDKAVGSDSEATTGEGGVSMECLAGGWQDRWPCRYDIVNLHGPTCPNGDTSVSGRKMNESGQPVGSWGCGFESGFPWIGVGGPTGTVLPLPPNASAAGARVINDVMTNTGSMGARLGEVAGIAETTSHRTFFYSGNSYTILPLIEGGTASYVEGINDNPIIVGYTGNFITANPPISACYWSGGEIATITPGRAFGINQMNQITGVIGSLISGVGFVWHDGKMESLPSIPGGSATHGVAINNVGHIAGIGIIGSTVRSFLLRDQEMVILGLLPGYKSLRAHDINDHDEMIGQTQHPDVGNQNRAFIWRNGLLVDLNDMNILPPPTLALVIARTINNEGEILVSLTAGTAKLVPVYGPLGDVNCDDAVNVADLLILLAHWGQSSSDNLPAARCDLNNDGVVGVADLLIMLANWGS